MNCGGQCVKWIPMKIKQFTECWAISRFFARWVLVQSDSVTELQASTNGSRNQVKNHTAHISFHKIHPSMRGSVGEHIHPSLIMVRHKKSDRTMVLHGTKVPTWNTVCSHLAFLNPRRCFSCPPQMSKCAYCCVLETMLCSSLVHRVQALGSFCAFLLLPFHACMTSLPGQYSPATLVQSSFSKCGDLGIR